MYKTSPYNQVHSSYLQMQSSSVSPPLPFTISRTHHVRPRQHIPIPPVSQSEQYFLKQIQTGKKMIFFCFVLNNDLISRTATKQINCHACRAKNIQPPFESTSFSIDSTCVMKLYLPGSQ